MRTSLTVNVVAGAISSVVSIVAAIVATPLYLGLLGAEAFGVLGFVLSLQAALLVLDGGVAVSATRAVAQSQDEPSRRETANLVYGLARVNVFVALAMAVLVALLASTLAARWLNLVALEPAYVAQSLVMAGIAIGARWPLALYQGVLMGRERLAALSAINALMTILTTACSVAIITWVSPDLRLLFGWMAVAGLAQVFWCRRLARQAIGPGRPPPRGEVPRFLRLSAAAGWLGLVGLLLMQVDKVVLSRVLPLGEFGYYVMAAMASAALYAVVTPVFNVLYPRLSVLASQARDTELRRLYRDSSLALAILLFPMAAALASFSGSILLVWTGDPAAARAGAPIVTLLSLATALHGIMFVPYALKLACGASRLALAIGVLLLVFSLPVTIAAALRWGGTGAAAAWLLLHVVYFFAGSGVTHRRLLPGLGYRWLLADVAGPALVSLGAAFSAAHWTDGATWTAGERTGLAALLVVACWILMAAASTRLRLAARSLFAKNAGT